MKVHYRISEAAQALGVCTKTIRRWDASGKIRCSRSVGNHRRISILEIERILHGDGKARNRGVAIYGRVSSHDQKKKGSLDKQLELMEAYCKEKGYEVAHVVKDVGSGLNAKRPGLKKLCKLIESGEVGKVVLSYPDRLTRFGFAYLTRYFESHGTSIEVMNEKTNISMQEELVQDLIAIITSFSGRAP